MQPHGYTHTVAVKHKFFKLKNKQKKEAEQPQASRTARKNMRPNDVGHKSEGPPEK